MGGKIFPARRGKLDKSSFEPIFSMKLKQPLARLFFNASSIVGWGRLPPFLFFLKKITLTATAINFSIFDYA